MSELGEAFSGHRRDSQEKRARNRASSADVLKSEGFAFETKNGGAHLIVASARGVVDFWPGTGKWCPRSEPGRDRRGVFPLVRWLRGGGSPPERNAP